ncbi:DUF927 domain-containing protein [Bradyrhizobium sp. MOS001]|uniref:DUF927 domain-containing protein n=1 Tax=Bradyrhizobium sp. MOS001 TaxID=2133948 RepID=UPI0010755CCE|nr:DUF927 domain-containing protein [Bradyrhizobium sp. MOS001]TFW56901.1 DUF927 domain-containing protein [Bradyrhizobium sp. MOS001]
MKKSHDRIERSKSGVFLVSANGRRRIAAPIRFKAIGHRLSGGKKIAMAEIAFVTRKSAKVSEFFDMSATTPRNRNRIIDTLADSDYRWPTESKLPERLIEHVLAREPDRTFTMVGAPGWYEDAILTSRRQFGKGSRFILDPNAGANVARMALGKGSLEDWQATVARTARKSSRLRLMIGAAFAALLLRRLNMDSFALNLFGTTSTGKTSALYAAGSVAGLFGDNGLPGWADSIPGLEQLAVGHRDGILPLDDTADEGGSTLPIQKKAKLFAFMFARNRGRNLDKSYEKKTNLSVKEFRVIALSTSEFALKAIAESAATSRIGGEEVRFIDVPAVEPGAAGIFDCLQLAADENPTEVRQRLVNELRLHAVENQGFAMDRYMRRVTKNPEAAVKRAKFHIAYFEAEVSSKLATGPDRRIAANFAVIYAGAALAIEYGILPWKKRETRAAIEKCMVGALATIRRSPTVVSNPGTISNIEGVARELDADLQRLTLVSLRKGERCSKEEAMRRESADGFRVDGDILIKPRSWRPSDAAKELLVEHQILRTQRSDAATIDRKVMGVPGKRRYYVIDQEKLEGALATLAGPPSL